ncbi:MAG TPA: biopolymer transporter ExbD [Caldithrix sp.]|nr:biopolymer transporter ExbD [Caldithrix sp.]
MAFIPSRRKKHLLLGKEDLNLTSMMDMMTIILVFLLKTYSTTGQIMTPSEDLKLPYSSSIDQPKKELNVSVTRHDVMIGSESVVDLSKLSTAENLIPSLYSRLSQLAEEAKRDEVNFGKPFNHEVIIQADEDTPFRILVKILYTCGQSEYNKLRLLTFREK